MTDDFRRRVRVSDPSASGGAVTCEGVYTGDGADLADSPSHVSVLFLG